MPCWQPGGPPKLGQVPLGLVGRFGKAKRGEHARCHPARFTSMPRRVQVRRRRRQRRRSSPERSRAAAAITSPPCSCSSNGSEAQLQLGLKRRRGGEEGEGPRLSLQQLGGGAIWVRLRHGLLWTVTTPARPCTVSATCNSEAQDCGQCACFACETRIFKGSRGAGTQTGWLWALGLKQHQSSGKMKHAQRELKVDMPSERTTTSVGGMAGTLTNL